MEMTGMMHVEAGTSQEQDIPGSFNSTEQATIQRGAVPHIIPYDNPCALSHDTFHPHALVCNSEEPKITIRFKNLAARMDIYIMTE